jgi:uroporphyrinogen decarboxylase
MSTQNLTSRERVLKAVNHQTPDRVPIDLGGFQTGIHREAYASLIKHLGIADDIRILDAVQQLAKPCEAVLQRFHVDTRYITAQAPVSWRGGIEQNTRNGKLWHDLKDEFGVVWSMPEDAQLYMDITHHPLANASIAQLADYPWPDGTDRSRFRDLRRDALAIRNETPYAICTGIGGVVYEYCWYLRGLETWLIDTIEDPAFCEALLDRTLKFWMDFYTGYMAEVGDLVDVVMVGDDLAGQRGPLFSPSFYRAIVKPRQKRLVQHIKTLTKAKIWYHTCGNCSVYIPDLIDNGVDILNPVQIGLEGMEPADLNDKYRGRIVFWGGGIDSQHVLPFAKPADVREQVRRSLAAFKPGGGYVFNNVHNIQAGVPAENIVAMYDAAYEFGAY